MWTRQFLRCIQQLIIQDVCSVVCFWSILLINLISRPCQSLEIVLDLAGYIKFNKATMQEPVLKYQHVFSASNVAHHLIIRGYKLLFAVGEFNMWLRPDGIYCGNINHYHRKYQYYRGSTFYKLEYDTTISYIVESMTGGFICETFQKDNPKIPDYEQILRKIGPIYPIQKGLQNEFFREKINYHCPDIQKQCIYQPGVFAKLLTLNGKIMNYLRGEVEAMADPVYVNDTFKDKVRNVCVNSWNAIKAKLGMKYERVEERRREQQTRR